ncbi:hypothetical protein BH10PSE16_BH10PSE16_20520 [soil metagenome]
MAFDGHRARQNLGFRRCRNTPSFKRCVLTPPPHLHTYFTVRHLDVQSVF